MKRSWARRRGGWRCDPEESLDGGWNGGELAGGGSGCFRGCLGTAEVRKDGVDAAVGGGGGGGGGL